MKRSREPNLLQLADLILPYLPPPSLAAAAATCTALRLLSLSITSLRSSDASRTFEPHPIPFLNSADLHPYSYFLYSPSSLLPPVPASQSWGGSFQNLPEPSRTLDDIGFGCDCGGDCGRDCPCWSPRGSEVMRECGGSCGCGLDCGNRATRRGVCVRLKVVRDSSKGWGLHAAEFVAKGEFVCEYAGEYLTTEEARRRQKIYDELASNSKFSPALLVVREHLPSGKACLRVNIDATKIGNVARFINHSCDGGNLSSILVRNSGSLLPRLCFFAATDVLEGQELTFSYGDARLRPKGLPCFCGTDACCGMLPSEDT